MAIVFFDDLAVAPTTPTPSATLSALLVYFNGPPAVTLCHSHTTRSEVSASS